jgi:AP-2 complex subunit beta-1
METKVTYVVQEAVIVAKDIFRRYPGQYEGIIPTLCEHLDILDEPESKASMIWIIGQFANRIDNADELMDDLTYQFLEEPVEVG